MKVSRTDLALAALRLVLGISFVLHGFPKIEHPTTWAAHVLPGTPPFLAVAAAVVEFAGGIAILVGFGTRVVAFLLAADMVVAIFFALLPHGKTFELPLVYLVVAFVLVMLGAGSASIDGARTKRGTRR